MSRTVPLAILMLVLVPSPAAWGQTTRPATPPPSDPPPRVAAAIAQLTEMDPSDMSSTESRTAAIRLRAAEDTIIAAGPAGLAAIHAELDKDAPPSSGANFFKLAASTMMWSIGHLAEANAIAGLWNTTPIDTQYAAVFIAAVEAAETRDARPCPCSGPC